MAAPPLTLLIVLTLIPLLIQGLVAMTRMKDENLTLKRRLKLINKPATKSFLTEHGDILDCVDIYKQHAFDHPLLKNHSIQMKPTTTIESITNRSSESTSSRFLPRTMRCPEGTVPIKRIQEEDLLMENFSPLFARTLSSSSSSNNVSNDQENHEIAGIAILNAINSGASASINVWSPKVKPDQYSTASFYVGTGDNAIQVGWMVNPSLYPTGVRLFTFWSRDAGQTTGCYDMLCPGFVQVSQKVHLGQVISPVSEKWKQQYFIDVEIRRDKGTKNWWLHYNGEAVGYWPSSLFSTSMNDGASMAGWGGEVYSPTKGVHPDMGSGYQGDLGGFGNVCQMKQIKMFTYGGFTQDYIRYIMNSRGFYTVVFRNDLYNPDWGNHIFFGGPKVSPNSGL